MMIDFIYMVSRDEVIAYDIETYKHCFTFTAISTATDRIWYFELSKYRDDIRSLSAFIDTCRDFNVTWVGYNNIGFDYPVVHWIYNNASRAIDSIMIHDYASMIIKSGGFQYNIWPDDRLVHQLDLYKIHHFDNKARSTSLKVLEFNMRMENIEDLPFPIDKDLTRDEVKVLRHYNKHDVVATRDFFNLSREKIRFRAELSKKYNRDFMNHNDTKIGKDYFIMELERRGTSCYHYVDNKRVPVQTKRQSISLNDVILPYIEFETPEFRRILHWFREQVITETKGVFTDVNCTVGNFQFDFGTGGIHGSIDSKIIRSENDRVIIDVDVASYYPNLAIANGFYPEHLGRGFCDIYRDVYEQRKSYAKGTAENAMLKLALNGVYGDSNNVWSPFYDPQYTMAITINGQLLLCKLAEAFLNHSEVELIQINTDGMTIRVPKSLTPWVDSTCRWWEKFTGLTLESNNYEMMAVRDVNNYIARYFDGSVKRKGAYEYDLDWHQNHSALVVPKAAEANLLHGVDIEEFILNHDDQMDFMLRAKVPRNSELYWGEERTPNITRYYISTEGRPLKKVMPPAGPLGQYKKANGVGQSTYDEWHSHSDEWNSSIHTKNRSRYEIRETNMNTGWLVNVCNRLSDPRNIDYSWYIKETKKLCDLRLN